MLYFIIFTVLYGLTPFFLHFFINRRVKNNYILPFTLVVFIASLYEFVGSFLLKINVEYWFLIYGMMAFIGIHYYFYYLLNKRFRLFFTISAIIFIISYVSSIMLRLSEDFFIMKSLFKVYQTIIILVFSFLWFTKIFQELKSESLLQSSDFYYVSGLLIYYCGTVFLFLSASSIYATDQSKFQYYWLLNIILNFVIRTLLIVGIWKARRV